MLKKGLVMFDGFPSLRFCATATALICQLLFGACSTKKQQATSGSNWVSSNADIMIGKKECKLWVFQGIGFEDENYLSWTFTTQEPDYVFFLEKLNSRLKFIPIAVINGSISPSEEYPVMQCFTDTNVTGLSSYYKITAISYADLYAYQKSGVLKNDVHPQIIKVVSNNKKVRYSLVDYTRNGHEQRENGVVAPQVYGKKRK